MRQYIPARPIQAADILLALIVSGPLLAPLFRASGLWPLVPIADWIIYPLGLLICPEDFMLPSWQGHVVAVCTRCYAAIGGLLLVRLSLTRQTGFSRAWAALPFAAQLLLIGGTILVWQIDVWGLNRGIWSHSHLYEMMMGLPLGLAIGLLVYSVIARAAGQRPAWELA